MPVKMKLRVRIFLVLTVAFLFVVSFKILEPELKDHGLHRETRDFQDYYDFAEDGRVSKDKYGKELDPIQHITSGSIRQNSLVEKHSKSELIAELIKKYKVNLNHKIKGSPWEIAASWVTSRRIHPEEAPEMGAILNALATRPIMAADVGFKGTQLKMTLVLEGNQKAVFKPKWYDRDYVVVGTPYSGADRHNGEIAAFHLIRLLGLNRAPLVVGRTVNLQKEILPVSSTKLKSTFFQRDNNTCFYGQCLYCKSEEDGVCADGEMLEGAVVLWLPRKWTFYKKHRSPWQRTYKEGKVARWEYDDTYCDTVRAVAPYDSGPRLLDLLDAVVVDYLIGNADRHHYETFANATDSMIIMLDNAKSFGNYYHDEKSILTPIKQCCLLRRTTWDRLQLLKDEVLSNVLRGILEADPLAPILIEPHLKALDRRLEHILQELHLCVEQKSEQKVFV
ncbi:glycosaminoglycan xylosylkinase isoform X1 [Lingula anatina]|uniref:Glycosaminoglycan xylosylkinase isoform X1 n=1 Tax=Lingula anatina TaxID=7574 RepID=A0A1S3H5U6_LINAN|nr:glycosaminoglycan xylosylkinase isoform X1 [Lingula anatina]XP_013381495.1 glycosaminoglycan xylosylkinase isoform X1 [Lingula anatina]XP_013381497.1 glycosaminoglycan xylosylkinase isoform X1 [Lingula anatina]XP_013381498.1 glycosaminoglycan xylosylkinase isoform X1 [Lingula anatina]|eukprot:XP_013381494.1 glycosaminoglycan xylosylkinase isoform X1 [Lingula anatina]